MSTQLMRRLRAECHQKFVGRTGEQNLFGSPISATKLPFNVLYVFGPGGVGKITYTLIPQESGTNFECELLYPMPNLLLALLDRAVLRRRVEAESAETLRL